MSNTSNTNNSSEAKVSGIKSVVIASADMDRAAAFYRDVLGIPLELEQHRGTARHYAAQLGELHFAIHDREGFWLTTSPSSDSPDVVVSFTIEDVESLVAHAEAKGFAPVTRTKIGPMSFACFRDPDGRNVCCGTAWPRR